MYQAPNLKSIEELRTVDVRSTNTNPIRIRATDFREYIVKTQPRATSKGVIKEWLCAHFLKLWNLPVPDFAVISVQPHHIPALLHRDLQPFYFDRPAFGSLLVSDALDVNDTFHYPGQYQKGLSNSSGELLYIALFDLWCSNADRHSQNYNLLYSADQIPKFIPIDHEQCLDTIAFGHDPELLTENVCLTDSKLFRQYVTRSTLKRIRQDTKGAKRQFDGYVQTCFERLPHIIEAMPEEWQTATPELEKLLLQTIFAKSWLDQTWRTYLSYLPG